MSKHSKKSKKETALEIAGDIGKVIGLTALAGLYIVGRSVQLQQEIEVREKAIKAKNDIQKLMMSSTDFLGFDVLKRLETGELTAKEALIGLSKYPADLTHTVILYYCKD